MKNNVASLLRISLHFYSKLIHLFEEYQIARKTSKHENVCTFFDLIIRGIYDISCWTVTIKIFE